MAPFIALTKPRVTAMTVFMAAGGIWLAGGLPIEEFLWVLLGVFLSVGCANGLNMVLERRTDALMTRTAGRPLPKGDLTPFQATSFSIVLGIASMGVLYVTSNLLTALLGLFAIAIYVGVYTPLKVKTTLALPIGAIPGAMPPLMGCTAVSGEITEEGLALFAILALWQIPHFLAISIANLQDYSRAGIHTVPANRGLATTRLQTIAYTTALIPLSLVLLPLGTAGWAYGTAALVSGVALLYLAAKHPKNDNYKVWAIQYFYGTLFYLPVVTCALALDVYL